MTSRTGTTGGAPSPLRSLRVRLDPAHVLLKPIVHASQGSSSVALQLRDQRVLFLGGSNV